MDLEVFKKVLSSQFSCVKRNARILVAVSGGVDSMVLLFLLNQTQQFKLTVAHCNYQLRKDSSEDEVLVRNYCSTHKIPFVSKSFQTKTIATKRKNGVQETARDLRYDFFNEVSDKCNIQWIATAHHKNDDAETILFNLIRGTEGLKGIPKLNGKVIRPMLPFTKKEIEQFAREKKIQFREDSSNRQNDYSRNRIRNTIFPKLEEINPAVVEHLCFNTEWHAALSSFVSNTLEQELHLYKKNVAGVTYFDFSSLVKDTNLQIYVYSYLPKHDLTRSQIADVLQSLVSLKSGITFVGNQFTYSISRGIIALTPSNSQSAASNGYIQSFKKQTLQFGSLTVQLKRIKNNNLLFDNPHQLLINADNLALPLCIRIWKHGDMFQPFGLKGRKKISDYLTDKKLHSIVKKNTLILTDAFDKTIAILGHTIDNNYRVKPETKKVLQIDLL